ncbi:MAG: hypothetical protein ACJ71O_06005 [Nitrososphaeraceae archaeon]
MKRRILLVDDEHDNSSIFTIGLQDAGFEVDGLICIQARLL